MVEALLPPSIVCLLLLIWFKSSAFTEYAKLFGLAGPFFVLAFEEALKKSPLLTYPEFLMQMDKSSFFLKLISCPLCASLWVSLAVSLSFDRPLMFPAYNILGLMMYGATNKLMEE